VTETQTIRMYPPEALVQPIPEPVLPSVELDWDTGELLDWLWLRGEMYHKAWREAEADKAGIRDWISQGKIKMPE